ncbi:mevalonate kinase [Canibacter zhoujuaniae]|uniref:mevalonate kinase n=1 Tax=Canibacter zhoujuaniae TaxID=2708343 RepID=UPI001423C6BB|nr:mevalonate kinase [Canibacter zhoujuaniae]
MTQQMQPVTAAGTAHGKSILIGEHSVVYGAPAIAFPLHALKVTATLTTLDNGADQAQISSAVYSGSAQSAPARLRPPLTALREAARHFGFDPQTVHLTIDSPIPVERGLGSSAAVSTAIVRAAAGLAGYDLQESERYHLVQHAERVAHGTSSGLDAHAVASSVPLLFRDGICRPLRSAKALTVVIADTGNPGKTSIAVGGVRALRENNSQLIDDLVYQLTDLTVAAETALANGEDTALGKILSAAHEVLNEMGVSSPDLNNLVRAAAVAGALGAKMTGGGLGGCIIALAPSAADAPAIAAQLTAAGAANTWVSTLDAGDQITD